MKKNLSIYGVKSIALELKDFDEGSRKVSGYFASFDTLDSDNDIIRKGAFTQSIKQRGTTATTNRQIAHLRNHDWEQQIGKLVELGEDSKGLFFVSQLGRSVKGNDAFLDYQDGILNEHSIGFNYIGEKINFVEDSSYKEGGYYEVKEVKLWEGSGVTFGANEFTPVIDVAKGLTKESAIEKLNHEFDLITRALVTGQGTDERLHSFEMRLKVLQQKYNSLIINEPCKKDTLLNNEPNQSEIQELKRKELLLKLLKN
jgi:HK97 family phage prohead protease